MKIGIGIVVGFFALLAVIGIGYNLLSDKTLEADSKEKTLIEKTKTPGDKKTTTPEITPEIRAQFPPGTPDETILAAIPRMYEGKYLEKPAEMPDFEGAANTFAAFWAAYMEGFKPPYSNAWQNKIKQYATPEVVDWMRQYAEGAVHQRDVQDLKNKGNQSLIGKADINSIEQDQSEIHKEYLVMCIRTTSLDTSNNNAFETSYRFKFNFDTMKIVEFRFDPC